MLPELGGGEIEAGNLGATFEAAARYLAALAGRRGLLVVLEDLHWADATSLSLVPFLARALGRDPVALLLTYRPDDEAGSPSLAGLRAEVRRGALGTELPLGPLSADDAGAMLAEVLGVDPAPEVATELLRLAAGNPFALQELAAAALRVGLDRAGLRAARRHRGRRAPLDPGRVDPGPRRPALPSPSASCSAWAAAIGERFDLRLLAARRRPVDQDEALASLARLAEAGLVVEDPADPEGNAFAFRHALVHEALSREGLSAQRRRRHQRLLEAADALVEAGSLDVSRPSSPATPSPPASVSGRSSTPAPPPAARRSSGRSRRRPPTSSGPSAF